MSSKSTKVRVNNPTMGVIKSSGIFIMSHLLVPDRVELIDDCFKVDGKGYYVSVKDDKLVLNAGEIELESDWWRNEDCNFDTCIHALMEWQMRIIADDEKDFAISFSDFYERFEVQR